MPTEADMTERLAWIRTLVGEDMREALDWLTADRDEWKRKAEETERQAQSAYRAGWADGRKSNQENCATLQRRIEELEYEVEILTK